MPMHFAKLRTSKRLQRIDELIEEGYTIPDIAGRLGYKTPALQFGRERVTVRNAYKVECLHRKLTS